MSIADLADEVVTHDNEQKELRELIKDLESDAFFENRLKRYLQERHPKIHAMFDVDSFSSLLGAIAMDYESWNTDLDYELSQVDDPSHGITNTDVLRMEIYGE